MVQMAYCDLSNTYHNQVTNVSLASFFHPIVGNFDVSPKTSKSVPCWGPGWALLMELPGSE